jgi:uncharacterized repeat protein (TIGR03803 family)
MSKLQTPGPVVFAFTRGQNAKKVMGSGLLRMGCIILAFCAVTALGSAAQTFTVLYSFCALSRCADGENPQAALLQTTDGSFYGTTSLAGAYGFGTIFKITASGSLTTLYDFDGTDGAYPRGALIQATDGSLYGTSSCGGGPNYVGPGPCHGTIFKIPSGGTPTALYGFCSQTNCTDGAHPLAGLIQSTDGNFYGTTYGGGANGYGTIFRITAEGALTTIYSFCSQVNCSDGSSPSAGLLQATDGNFYGTTQGGGSGTCGTTNSCGTLFQLTPSGVLTTLYNFCSQVNCADGGSPSAGLIQATDGNIYGITPGGGANGYGTIFQITAEGALTTLHSFITDGITSAPNQLLEASDGSLYGTTYGGTDEYGTIFKITLGGTFTTVHSFDRNYGAWSKAGLIQASNGSLYGTTWSGGAAACGGGGTVFSLDLSPSAVAISPTSLGFCNRSLNEVSVPKSVALRNTGTVPLTIASVTANGSFAVSANTCGAMLAAGKMCQVRVSATPTVLGPQTGALTFNDSAANSPQTVLLSATGVEPADLAPASASYGKQALGTTSAARRFGLRNEQAVALNNIAISTTGDFTVSATTCAASLAAKGYCTISVTFTPTATGTRIGQLSVSDSASNSPQTSSLKGTGE